MMTREIPLPNKDTSLETKLKTKGKGRIIMKQIWFTRLLISLSIIITSSGFILVAIKNKDYSLFLTLGMIDALYGFLIYMTTKASDKEKQETIQDLFRR